MASSLRSGLKVLGLAVGLAAMAASARAQDTDPKAWSAMAATGAYDLCLADAPDAAAVAERGEAWGWGAFTPYLEHPDGYKREAGGEARRNLRQPEDRNASVELTVQSGRVVSTTEANVHYFRCNFAADQDISADLTAYFTRLYGPPVGQYQGATVWLKGSAAAVGLKDKDEMAALAAGAVGDRLIRVELSNERGLTRAKLSQFDHLGAAAVP